MKYFCLTFSVILFFFSKGPAQEIQITASVSKNPVDLNEQFLYEVEVSGSVQNLPNVDLPDFEGFRVVAGPSTSSSYQIINFKVSASKTYTVYLMPRETGQFRIEKASVQFQGKTYSSEPIEIRVVKGATPGSSSGADQESQNKTGKQNQTDLSQVVFLKVSPQKSTAYINEEVPLSYKIYFRANITSNEVIRLPEAVGSWVEEYPTPQRPRVYSENVDGVPYNVAEVRKVAVFPSRPGKLTVSPLEMMVEIVARRQKKRDPFSLFDDFFGDPFGQVIRRKLNSGEAVIRVMDLPNSTKPADFAGLVGKFTINSFLDRKSISTDDALTYRIRISGTGLLKFLNTLPIKFSPDFEVYDPKISESLNKKGTEITSVKEFEYVIIPRTAGDHKIGDFRLTYFNPEDKKYHELNVPEYTVKVSRGRDMASGIRSGTALSKEEVQLIGQDIRFIKERLNNLRPVGQMPYQSWLFYISLMIPVIFLGMAWAYRQHLEKMSTNVEYARSRRAHKQARHRLKQADVFLRQHKVSDFYGSISQSLTGYIADKTNRPAAGLIRNDMEMILNQKGVENHLKKEFLECLDEADYRRFAPGEPDEPEMNDFYQRTEKILVGLEKYF